MWEAFFCVRRMSVLLLRVLAQSARLAIFHCFLLFVIFPLPKIAEADPRLDLSLTDHVAQELLVKFRQGESSEKPIGKPVLHDRIEYKTVKYQVLKRHHFSHLGFEHWKLAENQRLIDVIKQLKADPDVLLVEPNYRRYPRNNRFISPETATELSNKRLSQIRLTELRASSAASVVTEPVVVIIDDAFDLSHVDLQNKFVFPFDARDSDQESLDFDPSPDICLDEDSGAIVNEVHGTQVMGVLAANGTVIKGASETRNIIPVRIGCNYTVSAELAAFNWAIEKNADIVNISYGGPQYSEFERDAILQLREKNTLVVAAAGNLQVSNDKIPDYPSSLDLPNIISVAALTPDNKLAPWSQYGQTSVDIAAPGGENDIATTYIDNQYVQTSGTSFSAPFVSGVAASLLSRHPTASVYDIKAAILASVAPLKGKDKARLVTDGYVDAMAAHDLLTQEAMPVFVIKAVYIDDLLGNRNSQVERGEITELVVVIENIWADADSLRSLLASPALGISGVTRENAPVPGNKTVELRFPVDFSAGMQVQDLMFTLDLTGTYAASTKKFAYQRHFTVNTGSLSIGESIQAALKKTDQNQDEVHYYYVHVSEELREKGDLVFNLEMRGATPTYNANLLAKFGGLPQFDFSSYENSTQSVLSDAVSEGTFVSANMGLLAEQLVFNNALAGTYYIAVVSSKDATVSNIEYRLAIQWRQKRPNSRVKVFGLGCSAGLLPDFDAGSGNDLDLISSNTLKHTDPVLPILLVLSFIALFVRGKSFSKRRV